MQYPIDRFTMEVKRQLDVLDRTLAEREFLCGDEYTIADMANYAWYGQLVINNLYQSREFIQADSYTHVARWAHQIEARPAVDRGRRVNRPWGKPETRVVERHSAADFK
jgi:GST-like protein